MRLSEILNESVYKKWVSNKLGNKQAFKQLNKNCLQYLNNIQHGFILYRGDPKQRGDISYINTTNSLRTSKDYHNGYQLMMDASRSLKDVPSRSTSIICSTEEREASKYDGNLSVIVPFDGTVIACSGEDDFTDTIINHALFRNVKLEHLGSKMLSVFYHTDDIDPNLVFGPEVRAKDIDKVNTALSKVNLDSFCKSWADTFGITRAYAQGFLPKIYKKDPSKFFTNICTEVMTKGTLDIEAVPVGQKFRTGECWFSGECISIELDLFHEMMYDLRKAGFPVSKYVVI